MVQKISYSLLVLSVCILLVFPYGAVAQGQLTLSVTPPLFQIAASPGELFKSSVKVVNSNNYDLQVFAEVVNFAPTGENGQGSFSPVFEDAADATLAGWIDITESSITVPAERSVDIPFVVDVPENAAPGGHFAAILVGTKPPSDDGALVVQTSQLVTSLFFLRIAGDVIEDASIREFSVDKQFRETPETEFLLRFENKGNVHVQPRGDITIFNMWGKERGYIPVNHHSSFGNVLPDSVRKFTFSWKGESSLTDIGRYKAVATLGYGIDAQRTVDATTHFWVIPVKGALITFGSAAIFILFVVWAIRQYVRRAMLLAGFDPNQKRQKQSPRAEKEEKVHENRVRDQRRLSAPLRAGVIDLRSRIDEEETFTSRTSAVISFLKSYWQFTASVVVVLIGVTLFGFFIADVRTDQRNYEVTVAGQGGEVTISSEEILKDRLEEDVEQQNAPSVEQEFTLSLVNASGEPGVAARIALDLEELGYRVDTIGADTEREQSRTVVVYNPTFENEAVMLSGQLGNVLVSARQERVDTENVDISADILVVVGTDNAN